jgi:hypothetical protein
LQDREGGGAGSTSILDGGPEWDGEFLDRINKIFRIIQDYGNTVLLLMNQDVCYCFEEILKS